MAVLQNQSSKRKLRTLQTSIDKLHVNANHKALSRLLRQVGILAGFEKKSDLIQTPSCINDVQKANIPKLIVTGAGDVIMTEEGPAKARYHVMNDNQVAKAA